MLRPHFRNGIARLVQTLRNQVVAPGTLLSAYRIVKFPDLSDAVFP
jgi:hypothetical protein